MSSFEGLYVNSIHWLRRTGYGTGKPTMLSFYKLDETVIALMVIVVRNSTSRAIKRAEAVPLQEIFNDIPTSLRGGMLSWLILEGEEEPSSLIIHTGISMDDLARFATMRIMSRTSEKMGKGRFSFLNFGTIKKIRNNIEEVREQAKKSTLANSEPIARYLR